MRAQSDLHQMYAYGPKALNGDGEPRLSYLHTGSFLTLLPVFTDAPKPHAAYAAVRHALQPSAPGRPGEA